MAEITIRFRHNRKTGKRELVVKYESDSDAMAHEHESDHRALVERIIGRPLGDDEDLIVERTGTHGSGAATPADATEQVPDKAASSS